MEPTTYYIYKLGTDGEQGRIYLHKENDGCHTQVKEAALQFKNAMLAQNYIEAYYPGTTKYGVWPPANNTVLTAPRYEYYKVLDLTCADDVLFIRRNTQTNISLMIGFDAITKNRTIGITELGQSIQSNDTISRQEFERKLAEVRTIIDNELKA